jgi:hypothetical protein
MVKEVCPVPARDRANEQLQDGQTPQPPLSRLTGMTLEEFELGRAAFRMPLSDWLVGVHGAIPLGPLTIPADAAMACAIMTGLPARTAFTTSGQRWPRGVRACELGPLRSEDRGGQRRGPRRRRAIDRRRHRIGPVHRRAGMIGSSPDPRDAVSGGRG